MKKYKDFEKELENNGWKTALYYLGWLNVLSLIFWLSLYLTNIRNDEPFFNKRVIYVWGCIVLVAILAGLLNNLIKVF